MIHTLGRVAAAASLAYVPEGLLAPSAEMVLELVSGLIVKAAGVARRTPSIFSIRCRDVNDVAHDLVGLALVPARRANEAAGPSM